MKTEFELDTTNRRSSTIRIITAYGTSNVSIKVSEMGLGGFSGYLEGKDLERFAVNILKALKSNKLK